MAGRSKIEERIAKKEQEIQELEMKIREAKAYIQALQDVSRLLPRESEPEKVERPERASGDIVLRPGGAIYDARAAIQKAGRPLHITELLRLMNRPVDRKSRISVSSSLAAYVRAREIFTRPKPNTFGLVDMKQEPSEGEVKKADAPPDDFGFDPQEDDNAA